MQEDFTNVYQDEERARFYSKLDFPGTYYLAYRDLPELLGRHVAGTRALDFGCGAGRSTRFLIRQGFPQAVGVDISAQMIEQAKSVDPNGDYRLLSSPDLQELKGATFDLVLASFTFDNIPTEDQKVTLLRSIRGLLAPEGRILCLVSSPEIYLHEWSSFTTKDSPENRNAGDGDGVRIVMLDVDDQRPVEDLLCSEKGYERVFRRAGVRCHEILQPLGRETDPFEWVSESAIPPWTIYVLGP